jgi:hypothetical protein
MASHNSKYYIKKTQKIDAKGCVTISSMFSKRSESSEITAASNPEQTGSDDTQQNVTATEVMPGPSITKSATECSEPCKKVVVQSSFNTLKYEMKYPWLYFSSAKNVAVTCVWAVFVLHVFI